MYTTLLAIHSHYLYPLCTCCIFKLTLSTWHMCIDATYKVYMIGVNVTSCKTGWELNSFLGHQIGESCFRICCISTSSKYCISFSSHLCINTLMWTLQSYSSRWHCFKRRLPRCMRVPPSFDYNQYTTNGPNTFSLSKHASWQIVCVLGLVDFMQCPRVMPHVLVNVIASWRGFMGPRPPFSTGSTPLHPDTGF